MVAHAHNNGLAAGAGVFVGWILGAVLARYLISRRKSR